MSPAELGELRGALVTLEAGVISHPVLPVLHLGIRPRPPVHEAAQPREHRLAGAGLHARKANTLKCLTNVTKCCKCMIDNQEQVVI